MTTICYSKGILAADTQLTLTNIKIFASKIFILRPNFVISCAGDVDIEYKAMEFFRNPKWRQEEIPDYTKKENESDEKKEFRCIGIENGQPFFCHDSLVPVPIEHPFFAIGSGSDIAMGAMHLGLTPQQAVILASELDINTNDVVDYYDIQDKQIKRYLPAL